MRLNDTTQTSVVVRFYRPLYPAPLLQLTTNFQMHQRVQNVLQIQHIGCNSTKCIHMRQSFQHIPTVFLHWKRGRSSKRACRSHRETYFFILVTVMYVGSSTGLLSLHCIVLHALVLVTTFDLLGKVYQ
jgi:hypothetical protein